MSNSLPTAAPRTNRILGFVLLALVLVVALLPWWRNRGYVRSFYDYGVVMGGVGRIETGQQPYVDFVVPIQTGWFLFNWLAERAAGGTFQAMTWSAAASTAIATFLLGAVLLRRWPVGPAVIITGAVVAATVCQHTIFWYNPWGVVLLAAVAWSGAVAPVWRRAQAGWHAVIAAGLFLGGINKINMQLMALCLALGWAVRAALLGRATWGRVAGTAALYAVYALVLPVLFEMAWTGASFGVWWHNVIGQMIGSRSGMLLAGLRWEFLLVPCHNYYGDLRLPWVGLAGVGLTLVTTAALLRHANGPRGPLERVLAVLCGLIALLGGEVLLTTNMDIAYTALGGWLALLVALWLGFGVPARGWWFHAGLVLPALLIGAVSWESAWRGQRSQFGYSNAPRSAYRAGDEAGADYGYLRGTRFPPEMFAGLKAYAEWRAALPPDRRQAILYGPGTEWAAHIWPAAHTPELPLYILGGNQFGPKEYAATRAAVVGSEFKEITVAAVLDIWTTELEHLLRLKFRRDPLEWVFFRYSRMADDGFSPDPLFFVQNFGGSTDARLIQSRGEIIEGAGGRRFIGTKSGRETLRVAAPTNRLRGEVVVRRVDPAFRGALAANFAIFAQYDAEQKYPRWSQRVELPAGQDEVTVEYNIDSSHMAALHEVEIPPEFAGKVAAGWRGPSVLHAGEDGPAKPRWLQPQDAPTRILTPADIARIFPAGTPWLPTDVQIHGGRVIDGGVELAPGGEIWLRVTGIVTDFGGTATVPPAQGIGRFPPAIRSGWIKDARLELFTQQAFWEPGRSESFKSWSGEPGGWLFVAADYIENGPPVTLRFERIVHQPWP